MSRFKLYCASVYSCLDHKSPNGRKTLLNDTATSEHYCKSPVLFLIFNRPNTTRQVFEAIRAARPPRLYVAADGPRSDRSGEAEKCERAREIATAVDWECKVETLFREENLGCARAVSEAVTWFFDHEEMGIILEDDCLPEPSFFRFVDELLDRYRDDTRIALVSGNNFQTIPRRDDNSYYYSMFNHIWGWASWRRAWEHYDHSMDAWPVIRNEKWLEDVLCSKAGARYWERQFDETSRGNIDTWGYRWTYSCWREGMISVLPNVNLVKNIGFGADATHTRGSNAKDPSSRTHPMRFPLKHPVHMIGDRIADQRFLKTLIGKSRSLKRRMKKLIVFCVRGISQ